MVALALLIAACAPQIRETAPEPQPAARQVPENFPSQNYEQAAALGQPIYRIDPARSLVTLTVRRSGTLARLGHDHVVASHGAQGYVSPQAGRADLYFSLDELTVDEPALRVEAGLDTQPSESDIAGTRANMLGKVLQSQQHPFALIRVNRMEQIPEGMRLSVEMILSGVTRVYEVMAQSETQTASSDIRVTGAFEFDQSDFGITPFSILGGMIKVQDRISLRFRIHASNSG